MGLIKQFITGGPHIVGDMIPIVFFSTASGDHRWRLQVISLSEQNDLLRLLKAREIAMKAWNNDMMYIHTDRVICLYIYVYTYMYIHICIYIYIYISLYTHIYIYMYIVYIYIYVYVYIYVYIYIYIYMYYVCIDMWLCRVHITYVHLYMWINILIHLHV